MGRDRGRDMGDTDGASETCCQIRRAEGSVQHGRIAQPERVFGYAQIEGGAEEDQKRYGAGGHGAKIAALLREPFPKLPLTAIF